MMVTFITLVKPKLTGNQHFPGAHCSIHSSSYAAQICRGVRMTERNFMPNPSLISIVEDDQFFRESLRRLIKSQGYTVEAFSSAADFLGSSRLIETACVIADVNMPGMSGIELHRHLVNGGRSIPTILVTAYPNDSDEVRALNDGVVCYLRKPINDEHLMRCLRTALPSFEVPAESS